MSKQFVCGSTEWLIAFRDGQPVPKRGVKRSTPVPELARYHGKPCPYCGTTMMRGSRRFPTREHIIPRSRGGKLHPNNRLIVCSPCNHNKGDMTLEQFAHWLTAKRDPRAGIVWSLLDKFQPARA